MNESSSSQHKTPIQRHKTAIRRYKLSKPLSLAMGHELIDRDWTVLDYGCGRGEDVRSLSEQGLKASGWDPYFQPDTPLTPADVVNLGYVLNVIENPSERADTLLRAFSLSKRLLVVAVRVDQSLDSTTPFSDGLLTGRGSFQKLFSQSEFKEYIQRVLPVRAHMASLGVSFVFKDSELESRFMTDTAVSRSTVSYEQVLAGFLKDRIAQRFLKLARELGRLPVREEFKSYDKLMDRFGSASRVGRLALATLQGDDIEQVRGRRREDLLLYLAMFRLEGAQPPPFRLLPTPIQADLKSIWTSYRDAIAAGEQFLFTIGQPELVRSGMQHSRIGKQVGDAFYVHRECAGQIPNLLRLLVYAATRIVGEVEHDVLKITMDGRNVSFLRYLDFEEVAHPCLQYSIKVNLPRFDHIFRDYRESLNPPILHRKDTLVDPLHERFDEFRALSEAEERLGLLGRPDIGFKRQWEELLAARGIRIQGHTVQVISNPTST